MRPEPRLVAVLFWVAGFIFLVGMAMKIETLGVCQTLLLEPLSPKKAIVPNGGYVTGRMGTVQRGESDQRRFLSFQQKFSEKLLT
ncbi:MAG: hypothetical protein WBP85_05395 [Terracidiphilus sp.]